MAETYLQRVKDHLTMCSFCRNLVAPTLGISRTGRGVSVIVVVVVGMVREDQALFTMTGLAIENLIVEMTCLHLHPDYLSRALEFETISIPLYQTLQTKIENSRVKEGGAQIWVPHHHHTQCESLLETMVDKSLRIYRKSLLI